MAVDTNASQFSFNVETPGDYVLRLQPELYVSATYDLTATVVPSLGFPVAGNKARTGSFWGDARDGGQRSHEGIDIFAPKSTPVVASADGYITGVKNGGIGGKTVWLRATDRNIHLYYAHLDSQLVSEGDEVRKGDTLGLVGNTGNAQFTPPHLHFGVYTSRGPIDPYPFIDAPGKLPEQFAPKDLDVRLQLKPQKKPNNSVQPFDSVLLIPLAVNAKGYIAEHPNGNIIQAPFSSVKVITGNEG
ncbi:MAG: M23 family metallopeptidase [Sphingobacteriales bacterium]|nr:MAG: M23 family metallopeptidase [Sphingobacteriales bacterium]